MTTALYRRYRPETFEDVIGQEHVTEPLMTALRKNRVNHAYLFSGPRGCGKTTSARILARCLNCAEGPTATPCGRCESCRDLARDGAGSLDVIEMDAASHGGVDHARDLRERATFAPVRDRYKIFIIDEAHMVTREGFNALLKIVEEPPEHVKFIFATTEPSKVLTTIRSRTHHYPFRLVPPEPLMRYLEQLCAEEGVTTEPGVLSLVVRAGGGSVRDSLSVLDQLMAGSDEQGITYDLAVALLGYTHAALLDDVVDAFAAGDAATVFSSVDRVIQTGQDPRRFVEDLLERFRDLVVVNAVPDSAANILHGMPTDQINRLRNQATQLGAAELSRSADITNEALNEMTGATSPQLHLELLCARILLPSADDTTRGITSRVDRLERRLSIPRGAGIRQGVQDGVGAAAGTTPPAAPTPPVTSGAPATSSQDGAVSAPSAGGPAGEMNGGPEREDAGEPRTVPASRTEEEVVATGPEPSRPVRQDGSEAGHPTVETPDVAEPAVPEDEAEDPRGSEHPAAGDPVPREDRGPEGEHPPADGTTTDLEAGQAQLSPATRGASRPEQQEPSRSTGTDRAGDAPSGDSPAAAQDTGRPGTRPAQEPAEGTAPSDVTSGELELLRSSWPEIVSALAEIRRVAWAITVRGTPISFEANTLRVAFEGDGDIMNFPRFEGDVRAAIQTVVGLDCAVEAVRPGDTRGRPGGDAGGPPPGGGRGPSGGPGRAPDAGRGPEQPDYFREPEGFGVNRRRNAPAQPDSDAQANRANSDRRGQNRGGERDQGQTRDRERGSSGAGGRSPGGESAPSPEDDEPVTSWTVAAIPQPGATPAGDESSDPEPRDGSAGSGEVSDAPTAPPPAVAVEELGETAGGTPEDPSRRHSEEGAAPPQAAQAPRSPSDPAQTAHDRATAPGRAPAGGHPPARDRGPEYWSPEEPPPPPEDEPPADMYDEPGPAASSPPAAPGGRRPGWRERHAAAIAVADRQSPDGAPPSTRSPGGEDENFVPGADDESLEDSALYGRAAIERILGGMLIDERAHDTGQ
ncbi:DNA polymerase III subunit gamma and tau [Kocuria sp.]|uniref:DNA polymerase III subunit gamma and tau n=1 Tax=Kocuria sp. TaxID=1871328 RepID=UPI0026DC9100|nr:DNA polymerase III subunit gamma and tau [Kocuria sp.]MDO4918126.1 DNA polymerase III subunit gamma and tau [Kocuria sp.]